MIQDIKALKKLKSLTWKQPYASLMLHGKIETRTWYTHYRGWVLICSSQRPYLIDKVINISGEDQFTRIMKLSQVMKMTSGFAIAIGKLTDCRLMTKEDEDKCFVKYQAPWKEIRFNKKTGKSREVEVTSFKTTYTSTNFKQSNVI